MGKVTNAWEQGVSRKSFSSTQVNYESKTAF